MTSKEYFDQLLLEFPGLTGEFDPDDGDHYKMERFAGYTIKQIDASNWQSLAACFDFQEQRIMLIGPEIENALSVSFCEAILCHAGNNATWLIERMGPWLKKLYKEYEQYYINLGKQGNESITG